MSVEQALIVLIVLLLFWVAVLLHKEFSTADRKVKAIFDAEAAAQQQQDIRDLAATLWIYSNWRYITRNLTTQQRELWADVIDEWHAKQGEPDKVERWWR